MVMGSIRQETDVVVIGGGPGGYVAALRAADLGKEVVLIEERPALGGVCLIEGCIPSKTLIHATEVIDAARHAESFGVRFGEPEIDLDGLRKNKEAVVGQLTGGVAQLMKDRGVEVIQARARFESGKAVLLEGADVAAIEFKHAILATGSRIVHLPVMEGHDVWTSREALELREIPKRLLVVGGGYIGLELGFVYAGLGSEVTVVELLPGLLAGADKDLVRLVQRNAKAKFKEILTEAKVTGLEKAGDATKVSVERRGETRELEFDRVLFAVGRRPNSDELGLENTGVKLDERGFVEIDDECRTGEPTIFAIGDVTAGPALAHRASRQGKVAAEVIAEHKAAFDNRTVPAVVFTDPELAWAGITEDEAKEAGREVLVGRFPWAALGRARSIGRTDGVTKVLADPETRLVLGVGIVGPHASDLIAEAALAIEMGATLEDLMDTIHPHPTLSETIMEAADVAADTCVHLARPKKRKR